RLMADAFNADFIAISAVLAGVKDIRDAVARADATLAQSGRHTILFVDEVHRFNKAQQDAFLPFVEQGLLTFIGATTENPSFEVNSALLSRAAVYVLEPLAEDELAVLLDRALAAAMPATSLDASARDALIGYADGDGRRLIRMATEDIGLADPRALSLALDAVATYERLGSPEGELALAQCVLYLAAAPKSNAVYTAFGKARAFVSEDGSRPVPLRLRNAPTRLMKNI